MQIFNRSETEPNFNDSMNESFDEKSNDTHNFILLKFLYNIF